MSDPLEFINKEFLQLLFTVAKHVVTKQEVIDGLTQLVNEYTSSINKVQVAKILEPLITTQSVGIVPQVIPDSDNSYVNRFKRMVIRQDKKDQLLSVVKRLISGKEQYDIVEAMTTVPWWFIGIIHYRESDLDFDTYLGNGQSLHRITTVTPKGRGPFNSFSAGAEDALRLQGWWHLLPKYWTLGQALYNFESYNGLGYRNKGLPSPYLWAGSDQYSHGKYVADGQFDPNAVDTQLGCAVILKVLTSHIPIEFKFQEF